MNSHDFKINIANIYDVEPGILSCLALNKETSKLALFRNRSLPEIEIWDVSVNDSPYLEKSLSDLIKLNDGRVSIESIVWAQNRLFSAGLHGFVTEHDLVTRRIKEKYAATSGPVWCMSVNKKETRVAVGTEDGFVNIYDITQDGLVHWKVLDRQDGRILCCSWSPNGKFIATGSPDTVRLWNVELGHAAQRILTGRTKGKETVVWTISFISEFDFVTGDSRGFVCFWDGNIGVLKYKIQTHRADILSLNVNSKKKIYVSGVDPVVILLERNDDNDNKWVTSHRRNIHSNDVNSLVTFGNKLYSGGVDGDLGVSYFPPKFIGKSPPMPRGPKIHVSETSRTVLVEHPKKLGLWRLPAPDSFEELKQIAEIRSKHPIHCSTLSTNGEHFLYLAENKVSVFRLKPTNELEKIPLSTQLKSEMSKDGSFPWAFHASFIQDNQFVLISAFAISILKINDGQIYFDRNIDIPTFKDITLCTVSKSHVGFSDPFGSVALINIEEESFNLVPKFTVQATGLSLHQGKEPLLLISYLDGTVRVFDYKVHKIIFNGTVTTPHPILGVSWGNNGNSGILHTIDSLFLLEGIDGPKKKKSKSQTVNKDDQFTLKSSDKKYTYIGASACLKNELFIVEVKKKGLEACLPPALAIKRFGT